MRALVQELDPYEARHGDCVGADAQFHEICLELGIRVVIHPPSNPRMRAFCKGASLVLPEAPYLVRNNDIVDVCGVLLAAPVQCQEQLRSGTWATVRYARRAGRDVKMIWP